MDGQASESQDLTPCRGKLVLGVSLAWPSGSLTWISAQTVWALAGWGTDAMSLSRRWPVSHSEASPFSKTVTTPDILQFYDCFGNVFIFCLLTKM